MTKNLKYCKREIIENGTFVDKLNRFTPMILHRKIAKKYQIYATSFGMPESKIVTELPLKIKDFPEHIVDAEFREKAGIGKSTYVFATEQDYYLDLQSSRFGITTKRAGWDCMRHYEIAANGAVICFKDLDKKPVHCAPHHLVPGVNCLSYSSYDDLMRQINEISPQKYAELQLSSLEWIRTKTCKKIAHDILYANNRIFF